MTEQSKDAIQKFWQEIIENDEMPISNRMKASELLYHSLQEKSAPNAEEKEEEALDLSSRVKAAAEIIERYAKRRKSE